MKTPQEQIEELQRQNQTLAQNIKRQDETIRTLTGQNQALREALGGTLRALDAYCGKEFLPNSLRAQWENARKLCDASPTAGRKKNNRN